MPRKHMGSTHGIGIKRNDYRKRNRKRNISMHSHSHGYNRHREKSPLPPVEPQVTKLPQAILGKKATDYWDSHRGPAKQSGVVPTFKAKCFTYVRHQLTNYDVLVKQLVSEQERNGDTYDYILQKICRAIAEAYPWLAGECEKYLKKKMGFFKHQQIRIIKRPQTLTELQIAEHNAREEEKWKGIVAALEQEETANEEYEVSLTDALSSLASERLLYFPPFLKKDEIQRRRFGSGLANNDRWWEWEKELGLERTHEATNVRDEAASYTTLK